MENRNTTRNILNAEQERIRDEFVSMHGLDKSQISFEGDNSTPILDYEAVNTLSLRLTDIQDIQPTRVEENGSTITVYCAVTLPDGRTRGAFGSCEIGETLYDDETVGSRKLAEATATSRAFRRGIRAVGVNLVRAHEEWKKSGAAAAAHTNNDPRHPLYQEINRIAFKVGYKMKNGFGGVDKSEYEKLMATHYDGKTSAKDLNDLEIQRFTSLLRTIERLYDTKIPKAA